MEWKNNLKHKCTHQKVQNNLLSERFQLEVDISWPRFDSPYQVHL